MKTNTSRKESGTPVYCYVVLIALTATLCTYFFAKAINYNHYTIVDDGIEMMLPSDSTDPAEVLSEAGITLSAGDSYSVSENDTITIVRGDAADTAQAAQLAESITASGTAAETEASTAVKSAATSNSTRYDTEIVEIPYDTVTYRDASLAAGTTKVQTEGVNGQNQVTTCTTIVNGKEVSSEVVSTVTLSQPVTEVILTGTASLSSESGAVVEAETEISSAEPDVESEPAEEEPVTAEATLSDSDSDSAAAAVTAAEEEYTEEPAEEEPVYEEEPEPEYEEDYEPEYEESASVSGNTITTSDGTVLTYSSVLSVTATAYTGGGITATGTTARYGEIAVDPSVIPYGTRMYIMTDDGTWIYGYATAEDCGGAIKGNIIDLYFDSYDTCCQFGRRSCTVYILD